MRRFLILVLMLAGVSGQCQMYTITDSFVDNRMNWWEGESQGGSQHIVNDKLLMQFPKNGWTVAISPYLVFEKDFTMQASLRQTVGANNDGFGIVWGYNQKANDYNYFQISTNGYFIIANTGAEKGKDGKGVSEWVRTTLVKPIGEVNVLKVEQKSRKLTFFINGQSIFTTSMFHWRGSEIGFTASAQMTVQANDFSFQQEGLKINLPPNLTKGFVKENLGPNINTLDGP